MTKTLLLISAFMASVCFAADTQPKNLDKNGVILKGFDPVSYFNDKEPQKGNDKIRTTYEGATYLFANEKNKEEFLKNPAKYAPAYGGWCAYAVADSKSKVDIDPKKFVIENGKLLVFYDGWLGHTREKWLKDPKGLYQKAEANWPEVEKKEP